LVEKVAIYFSLKISGG